MSKKINYVEKINDLVKYAKQKDFGFPTLTQKLQQTYARNIVQTGQSKRFGEVRTYEEYINQGKRVLKENFKPISSEEYEEELAELYKDLKGYRSKSAITIKQYNEDAQTIKTLLEHENLTDFEMQDYLDELNLSDKKRNELLKEAYQRWNNNRGNYSEKYGYFEAFQEVLDEEIFGEYLWGKQCVLAPIFLWYWT